MVDNKDFDFADGRFQFQSEMLDGRENIRAVDIGGGDARGRERGAFGGKLQIEIVSFGEAGFVDYRPIEKIVARRLASRPADADTIRVSNLCMVAERAGRSGPPRGEGPMSRLPFSGASVLSVIFGPDFPTVRL